MPVEQDDQVVTIVDEVLPINRMSLGARAQELAHELAAGPRMARAGIMQAVQPGLDDDLDTALDAERVAVGAGLGTPDQAEGRQAPRVKRDPVFE